VSEPKPRGSGYFAALCGALFGVAFVGSFFRSISEVTPEAIMRAWLLFITVVLLWWGINRIQTGRPDRTVGQDTINLVVGLVGATVALLGLLKK
jgi:hypothetical protein